MHPGTLSNLKLLLERTNVNGQVKSTCGYEPHKDFAILMLRYVNTIARDILTKRVSPSIAQWVVHFISCMILEYKI